MNIITSLHQLSKSQGLRHSLLSIIGNTAATGLSAIATIFISRMLGPSDFGIFSVGFSIVLILVRLNDLGITIALNRLVGGTPNQATANSIFSESIKIRLLISILILLLGSAFSGVVAQQLKISNSFFLTILVVSQATTWYEQLIAMVQSSRLVTQSVITNLIQASGKLISAAILFVSGLANPFIVFLSYMLSPALPLIFSKWLLPRGTQINLSQKFLPQRRQLLDVLKHSSVAFAAAGLIENSDVLFVQKYLDTYETGLYSGVSRIALLLTLISYYLGNVLNPRVARYKELSHLSSYLKKSWLIVLLSCLLFIVFLPLSKILIYLTIGPEYISGSVALIILIASSLLTLAAIPFISIFYSLEKDWYFSSSGILQLIIIVGGNMLVVPEYGLMGAAWIRLLCKAALFIFTVATAYILINKKYGVKHAGKN